MTDEELAVDIAGRLGIEIQGYKEVCSAALQQYANLKLHQAKRFHYSEIGSSASGAMKTSDNKAATRKN